MPKSKEWGVIYHNVYGELPSVAFLDEHTIDAFSTRSAWAFAEQDDPMAEREGIDDQSFDNQTNALSPESTESDVTTSQKEDIFGWETGRKFQTFFI